MASTGGGLKTNVETHKYEDRVASTKQTGGGEFIWSKNQCTGCIKCVRRCPVEAITVVRQKAMLKKVGITPCSQACPAGIDVPRYLRFIAEGKYPEAVAVIREKVPFPAVCGYVCLHPCQDKCQRNQLDEPILIRVLKRFAVEHDTGLWKQGTKKAPATGKRVAIVGSGPAGLTAAYYLTLLGHSVTVFEAMSEPGGKMIFSIPDYDLPKDIVRAEIKDIEDLGVEIKTDTKVDSVDSLFEQGYEAVLLTVGVEGMDKGMPLPIPGADLDGVLAGTAFLKDVSQGKEVKLGKSVVVLGGGSVGFNCALTALQQGASDVHMVGLEYWSGQEAALDEIDQALEMGIVMHPLLTLVRVVSSGGKVKGIECLKVRSFGFDSQGRVQIDTMAAAEKCMDADTVISTIGKGDTVQFEPGTLVADREGVFAGGDAVSGARSVIEAIAAGRWSAISIDKYLGGKGNIEEVLAPPEEKATPLREAKRGWPPKVPTIMHKQPSGESVEVELSLKEKEVIKEAKRCLRCDLGYLVDEFEVDTAVCTYCGRCVDVCIWDAISAGYGYELAAKEREERAKLVEERSRVYNNVITLLVAAVAIIVLAVVAVKLFTL